MQLRYFYRISISYSVLEDSPLLDGAVREHDFVMSDYCKRKPKRMRKMRGEVVAVGTTTTEMGAKTSMEEMSDTVA
eukprot:8953513-Ditylum_brightwellii.AAC.1